MAESFAKYKSGTKSLLIHGLTSYAHTFSTFRKRDGCENVYKVFHDLAEGSDKPFLLCYGGTGNGKTHLCEALTIRLMQRGIDTWYYSVAGFMNLLKRQMETNELDAMVKIFCEVQGLVLDDWGAEYGSDWERTQLDHIIDERYRWRRITVLTTNKDVMQLDQQSQRIVSRFTDKEIGVLVLNRAADFRPKK
jgi:DNA replication protein DnaC